MADLNERQAEVAFKLVEIFEWSWINIGFIVGALFIVCMSVQTYNEWKNK